MNRVLLAGTGLCEVLRAGYERGKYLARSFFINQSPRPVGYRDLKPCTVPRFSILPDRNTGDPENCPGKVQPVPGMLEIRTVEDVLLMVSRYTCPVVLVRDDEPGIRCTAGEPDLRYLLSMADPVFKERVKYFFKKRVGVNLRRLNVNRQGYRREGEFFRG